MLVALKVWTFDNDGVCGRIYGIKDILARAICDRRSRYVCCLFREGNFGPRNGCTLGIRNRSAYAALIRLASQRAGTQKNENENVSVELCLNALKHELSFSAPVTTG